MLLLFPLILISVIPSPRLPGGLFFKASHLVSVLCLLLSGKEENEATAPGTGSNKRLKLLLKLPGNSQLSHVPGDAFGQRVKVLVTAPHHRLQASAFAGTLGSGHTA